VKDSHYTPEILANYLVSFIKKQNVGTVGDFCVGEGELLKAVKRKWFSAQCYGSDISVRVIKMLKKQYPDWILGKCDFFNRKSRDKSIFFNKKFDLIILNPPFTCKGATIHSCNFDGIEYHMSAAMAFFVSAIQYLNTDGVLYAILPQSVAYSQKDYKIRKYLFKNYSLKIFEEINNQEFEKCTPNIVLAAVNDKELFCCNNSFKQIFTGIEHLKIQRGNISMHNIAKSNGFLIPLIHSTNLKNNKIVNLKYNVESHISRIEGPALLIPRVGQPNINKISIISSKKIYAISDCIIGIKTDTMASCRILKKIIVDNWLYFSDLYKGTGAKYITIERLKYFLNVL
jgi:tRNA1(Val) A37 N6-methylase TrmN6